MEAAIYVVVQQKQKHSDKHPLSLPTKKKKKKAEKSVHVKKVRYMFI